MSPKVELDSHMMCLIAKWNECVLPGRTEDGSYIWDYEQEQFLSRQFNHGAEDSMHALARNMPTMKNVSATLSFLYQETASVLCYRCWYFSQYHNRY